MSARLQIYSVDAIPSSSTAHQIRSPSLPSTTHNNAIAPTPLRNVLQGHSSPLAHLKCACKPAIAMPSSSCLCVVWQDGQLLNPSKCITSTPESSAHGDLHCVPPACTLMQPTISRSHVGDKGLVHLPASSARTLKQVVLVGLRASPEIATLHLRSLRLFLRRWCT